MKRIGLLSDTHGYIDDRILEHLKDCNEIWHAGDIGDLAVIDALTKIAPVKAVWGNIDNYTIRSAVPENQRFLCEGKEVWITHIGGKPYVYNKVTRPVMLSDPPDIFICGHSHILLVQYDKKLNCLCLNPGAAGIKGFHKVRTLLRFTIDGKTIKDMEVVELGPRSNADVQQI